MRIVEYERTQIVQLEEPFVRCSIRAILLKPGLFIFNARPDGKAPVLP